MSQLGESSNEAIIMLEWSGWELVGGRFSENSVFE